MSTNRKLGYHIQMVLPKGTGKTSAQKIQQRLHDRGVDATISEVRRELGEMDMAGLVSYSNTGTPRWGAPTRLQVAQAKLRAPLAEGHPRRLTDARCAWRKMSPEQRGEFLNWMQETEDQHAICWDTGCFIINVEAGV
jgi:hypothetical protein